MSDTTRIARGLAAAHPDARLLCPVCGAMLSGVNLDRHLARHPDPAAEDGTWRGTGLFRGRLWTHDSGLALRALGRRRDAVPVTTVTAGPASAWRPDPALGRYPDAFNGTGEDARSGSYLRLSGAGAAITVRCRSAGRFRKVWTGWEPGRPARTWHITLDMAGFVAVQYALAEAGLLRLRDA